ncbi:hypothetical protein N1851_002912 [Merluccius polli]|uniref:Uncharacterized protein n=1 Tax=Merluccius polli TaxID=89951 RepID=A0AA47NAQ7_MERPO|nr:hypothetical protein N1851_002912 [Merluccius polli]
MLSDILERLAEKVYTYKAYPKDADFSDVAEALTSKHLGLSMRAMDGNKGSSTSAKLTVNYLKSKSQEEAYTAKNLKRPRQAEVKHFPSLPSEETPESLEQERISILAELQKRNN